MKKVVLMLLGFAVLAVSFAQTSFTVRIENVSNAQTLSTSEGSVPVPLAPGVWTLHKDGTPLFAEGELDFGQGLEALAEDGDPSMLIAYLSGEMMHDDDMMDSDTAMTDDKSDETMTDSDSMADDKSDDSMADDSMMDSMMMAAHSGVFNTPVGAQGPGPLLPGGVYEFSFDAEAGDRLSFATMFVQSNDWFYAPAPEGIALFDEAGNPISGDIAVSLWDAGTEADEEPGVGATQAPRQMSPNDGEAQIAPVTLVGDIMTNGPVIKVSISVNQ